MAVYDREFTDLLEERWRDRPPEERPGLHFVVTSPERRDLRSWLDEAVEAVPLPARDRGVARLRNDRQFLPTIHEVGVAYVLQSAGYSVDYEPEIAGTTPDFLAHHPEADTPLIVEVWTRSSTSGSLATRRAWQALGRRIAKIPVSVGMSVSSVRGGECEAPSPSESKATFSGLKDRLLHGRPDIGVAYEVGRFRFRVVANVPGLFAVLAQPGGGGTLDTSVIEAEVRRKVHRYKPGAAELGAPMIIVMAGDSIAPMSQHMVQSAWLGTSVAVLDFSIFDEGPIGKPQTIRIDQEHAPSSFGGECAAIGWLDLHQGDPALDLYETSDGPGLPTVLRSSRISQHHLDAAGRPVRGRRLTRGA